MSARGARHDAFDASVEVAAERRRCIRDYRVLFLGASGMNTLGRRIFLVSALWVPVVVFIVLMILDWADGNSSVYNWKQFLTLYVLWFGIPSYIAFAAWATRAVNTVTERQILKKIWYAPLTFIPFYAAPWLIAGLALLLLGNLGAFAMMVGWLAFLPYLLIAGYVIAGLTVALYRTVFS